MAAVEIRGQATPPTRVLVIGDSISALQFNKGMLSEAMKAEGLNVQFVGSGKSSDAFGGFTLDNMCQLVGNTYPQPNVNAILIEGGTNDLGFWKDGPEAEEHFKTLLGWVKKRYPTAHVFVAPIPPILATNPYGVKPEWVPRFNRVIETESEKAGVTFIGPLPSDFEKLPYEEDGLHPKGEGLRVISDKWAKALATYLRSAPSPVANHM